jgi:hypothetical protein
MFYDAGVEIAFSCLRGEGGTRKRKFSPFSQPPLLVNKFYFYASDL